MTSRFVFRSPMPVSADSVFAWHSRPGAFERLSPPWEAVKVLERMGGVEDGGRVVLGVRAGGFWRRWVAEHCDYEKGRQFCDVQTEGPFAY
jgi:ligand-binding SRPBCC domain-containing protein